MRIVRVSYTDDLQKQWLHDFYEDVLTGLYNEDLIPDFDSFFGNISDPHRMDNWYCMLAMAGTKPVGGVTAEYMPNSNCCIIEFLQTSPEYNSVQVELLGNMVQLLHDMHRKAKHIFIELVPNAGNLGDGFYADWCRKLDVKYVTPQIKEDAEPGLGLVLCLVDELTDHIPSYELHAFLSEYFTASFSGIDVEKYIPHLYGDIRVCEL